MTADAFSFTQWFFTNIWRFFTEWLIPGTAMTPAQWLFFILFVFVIIPLIYRFFKSLSS